MNIDYTKVIDRKVTICDEEIYSKFSVLIPLIKTGEEYSLIFETRSENLSKQPNEICFPGGKIENFENARQAAVRETSEELLIPESSIDIIAELDTVVTPFNSILYPFAGELDEYAGTFNPEEVRSIFSVPMSFFVNTNPLQYDVIVKMNPEESFPYHLIPEGRDYPWSKGRYPIYFYIYEDKTIWGITARIVNNLIKVLTE